MYELWYDYVKPKYGDKVKVCYMVYIKTDDIYKDIAADVETKFATSNHELERPLPRGKNKKVTELIKDELDGKIMKLFTALREKTYSHLTDNNGEDKTKGTKSVSQKLL